MNLLPKHSLKIVNNSSVITTTLTITQNMSIKKCQLYPKNNTCFVISISSSLQISFHVDAF